MTRAIMLSINAFLYSGAPLQWTWFLARRLNHGSGQAEGYAVGKGDVGKQKRRAPKEGKRGARAIQREGA